MSDRGVEHVMVSYPPTMTTLMTVVRPEIVFFFPRVALPFPPRQSIGNVPLLIIGMCPFRLNAVNSPESLTFIWPMYVYPLQPTLTPSRALIEASPPSLQISIFRKKSISRLRYFFPPNSTPGIHYASRYISSTALSHPRGLKRKAQAGVELPCAC